MSIDNMTEQQAKLALHKEAITSRAVKGKLWATGQELKRTQTTLDLSLNMLFSKVTDQTEAMDLAGQLELYTDADTGSRGWVDTYTSKTGRVSYAHYMGTPTNGKYCGKAKLGDDPIIYTNSTLIGMINECVVGWEYDSTPTHWSRKFKPVLSPDALYLDKLQTYKMFHCEGSGDPPPAFWNGAVEKFNQWKRDKSGPEVLLAKVETVDDRHKQAEVDGSIIVID